MVGGDYQLSTQNAVYSFGCQYHAFNQAFEQLDFDKPLKSVLVLGGGLGSVCEILQKRYGQEPKFTLVEYDDIICELARSTLSPEVLKRCKLVNIGAATYVKNCREQFDLIIVDLFQDIIVPDDFLQESFLKQLRSLFAFNCRLLFNMIITTQEAEELALRFYKEAL